MLGARVTPLSKIGHRVACLCLGYFVLAHAGSAGAAEVVHACDAPTYRPCPQFSASVELGEHEPLSTLQGFTRSRGSWTVHVQYEPKESCAIVKLFVDMGPIDFYREYRRVLIDGHETMQDSGTFMHKEGDVENALGIATSSCYVPGEQPMLPASEDPVNRTLDHELARHEASLEPQEGEHGELDRELERLFSEEAEGRLEETRERAARAVLEMEREAAIREQARRNAEHTARLLRQQRAERERIESEASSAEGIATFFQLLGTGLQLYQILNEDSASHGASGSFPAPSATGTPAPRRSAPTGLWGQPCTTAQGRPGYTDAQGTCHYDDTSRSAR